MISTMPVKSPPISECTHLRIRKLSRWVSRFYDAALAPLDLKATQFSLLAHLSTPWVRGQGALQQGAAKC